MGPRRRTIPPEVVLSVVLEVVEKVVFRRNSQVSAGGAAIASPCCSAVQRRHEVRGEDRRPKGNGYRVTAPVVGPTHHLRAERFWSGGERLSRTEPPPSTVREIASLR